MTLLRHEQSDHYAGQSNLTVTQPQRRRNSSAIKVLPPPQLLTTIPVTDIPVAGTWRL